MSPIIVAVFDSPPTFLMLLSILHDLLVCVVCVVRFSDIGHNSATKRNYVEPYIYVCCSKQGESISDVFRTSRNV